MLFFHVVDKMLLLCCFEHDSINWIVAKLFKGLAGGPLADVHIHILSDLLSLLTVE